MSSCRLSSTLLQAPGGRPWNSGGGLIQWYGYDGFNAANPITTVTANAAINATQLLVASTSALKAGDWVRLTMDTPFPTSLFAGG